jgi:hypothetical protein
MGRLGWTFGVLWAAFGQGQEAPVRRFGEPAPPRPELQVPFPDARFAPALPEAAAVKAARLGIAA